MNYYNEHDKFAAAWLRELIKDRLIPDGCVDERSIKEVHPDDLRGYTQHHFFAGISGWTLALDIADFPRSRRVICGSAPCQPFSSAGKRKGKADDRDLWPDFFRVIRDSECPVVFGEQVASGDVVGTELEDSFVAAVQRGDAGRANKLAAKIARKNAGADLADLDRRWVDRVRADLESENYTFRFRVLGAHSASAPHIRQRLYWSATRNSVADPRCQCDRGRGLDVGGSAQAPGREVGQQRVRDDTGPVQPSCRCCGLADADGGIAGHRGVQPGGEHGQQPSNGWGEGWAEPVGRGFTGRCGDGRVDDATGQRAELTRSSESGGDGTHHGLSFPAGNGLAAGVAHGASSVGDTGGKGLEGRGVSGCGRASERAAGASDGDARNFWSDYRLVYCRDGKYRRIPIIAALFPLVASVSGRVAVVRPGLKPEATLREEDTRLVNRVGALRGAGNAINIGTAVLFIRAFLEEEAARTEAKG